MLLMLVHIRICVEKGLKMLLMRICVEKGLKMFLC